MLNATRGHILIEILLDEILSPSGLYLVRNMPGKREIAHRGRVIALGLPEIKKGKELPQVCEPGEIAHFKKYAGKPFEMNRKRYLSLKREEILAVSDETQNTP